MLVAEAGEVYSREALAAGAGPHADGGVQGDGRGRGTSRQRRLLEKLHCKGSQARSGGVKEGWSPEDGAMAACVLTEGCPAESMLQAGGRDRGGPCPGGGERGVVAAALTSCSAGSAEGSAPRPPCRGLRAGAHRAGLHAL